MAASCAIKTTIVLDRGIVEIVQRSGLIDPASREFFDPGTPQLDASLMVERRIRMGGHASTTGAPESCEVWGSLR